MQSTILWFKKIFFVLFGVSGVFLWLIFSIDNFKNEFNNSNHIFTIFSIGIILLSFIYALFISMKYSEKIKIVHLFVGILIINILYVLLFGMNTLQISDFKLAFDGPFDSVNYTIFPSWLFYSVYLQVLKIMFGNNEIFPILFNCILNTTCVILLYKIVKKTGNSQLALLSGILLGIWPSRLGWNIVLSPDLLNQLFIMLGLYFFVEYLYINSKKDYISFSLVGGCLAIGGWFKNTGIIMLIAFVIFMFLEVLRSKEYKKVLKQGIILLASFIIIQNVIWGGLCIINGRVVDKNPMPHYLYVGLSKEGNGGWFENCDLYSRTSIENKFNYSKSRKIVYEKLKQKLYEDNNLNANFFKNKIKCAFASEGETLFWMNMTMKEGNLIDKNNIWNLVPIYDSYYIIILVGILIASINSLYKFNTLNFISSLYIYGFYIILIVLEVQQRYKMILYPFMIILSGYGYIELVKYIQNLKYKYKLYKEV